ncbi:MAG: DinB family protein [Phycisphaerales bacterium]
MTINFAEKPILATFQAMPTAELVERYRRGTELIERRLLELSDEQLDTFFRPETELGRWSCRVLMGHLADAELVFVHRMRRAVAEEKPVLALWDENAFIDSGVYGGDGPGTGKARPVAAFVAVIHTLRMWHGEWLRTLSSDDWDRVCLHPERGEQSVRTILNYATWHHEHHLWYLRLKLDRLMGGASGQL